MNTTPLASKLIALAAKGQYGHSRAPRNFGMGDPDRDSDPNSLYCEYYWSNAKWDMTYAEYVRVARLSTRYRRYVHYMTEIKPAWQNVGEVLYADNSVEAVQRATDGRTRQVTVKAPSGDACF